MTLEEFDLLCWQYWMLFGNADTLVYELIKQLR